MTIGCKYIYPAFLNHVVECTNDLFHGRYEHISNVQSPDDKLPTRVIWAMCKDDINVVEA